MLSCEVADKILGERQHAFLSEKQLSWLCGVMFKDRIESLSVGGRGYGTHSAQVWRFEGGNYCYEVISKPKHITRERKGNAHGQS
jgi:hypothetical protein